MTTAAKSGHGASIQIGDGASPVEGFVALAEVNIDVEHEVINRLEEVTNHQSSGKAEHAPTGVQEFADVPISGNWISTNTQHTALETDARATTKRNFKVVTSDATPVSYAFAAYIERFKKMYPVNAVAKFSATLRITGAVTKT